jgi:hypothetical protein
MRLLRKSEDGGLKMEDYAARFDFIVISEKAGIQRPFHL